MTNLVKLMITIENDEQVDKVLEVLKEAEEQGELDFPFDVERQDQDRFLDYWPSMPTGVQPVCDNLVFAKTFGDKNDPLI